MTDEPTVSLITVCTRSQFGQLVTVSIEVDTSFPVPTVLVVDDDTVQR